MSANPPSRILRFSTFEVNLDTGELRQRGQRVKLQEQPFQVLAALLERPGEVVSREELRRRLWPADTFVDFDHGLNAAIKRLRDALGESSESPVFIETMARRGYRFIAPVGPSVTREDAKGTIFTPTPAAKDLEDHRAGIRWRSLAALAIVVVGLVGALLFAGLYKTSSQVQGQRIKSLAVLPLENLSHDPEQEYFSDGMTEALTDDLAKIASLRVVSRTSAMRYKAPKKSLQEIARELNVDAVIEGSVLRSGNRIRITAELIDARTDQQLWGQSYEHDLGDVLMLQRDVAQAIAERIHARLTPQQQSRVRSTSVVNPEAYEAYLKGRFYERATDERTTFKHAQGYYEDAVRKDPTFALAYVGLADCSIDLGEYRLVPPQDAYRQASEAIHKALQLDEALAEAHSSRGFLAWRFEWNWHQAETELRYAVELDPNAMAGHEHLVWYLSWSGRRGEALAEVKKMTQLDPAYPFTPIQESGVYYHQRDYKSLVEAGEKSVAAYPNDWTSHYFLAVGYEGSGRPAQAIPEYQRAVQLSEADTDAVAGLAHAYVASGKRVQAEKMLREMQEQSKMFYVSPYMIGAIYASLGNKDKAFEFLEKAYKEKSPDVAYFLKADFRVDALRPDPRFQSLLRRLNFPDKSEEAGNTDKY